MIWLLSIFSGISTRLVTMGAVLLGLFTAIMMIRKSGADAEKNKQTKRILKNVEIRNEVERDVRNNGSATDRLRSRWTRK